MNASGGTCVLIVISLGLGSGFLWFISDSFNIPMGWIVILGVIVLFFVGGGLASNHVAMLEEERERRRPLNTERYLSMSGAEFRDMANGVVHMQTAEGPAFILARQQDGKMYAQQVGPRGQYIGPYMVGTDKDVAYMIKSRVIKSRQ